MRVVERQVASRRCAAIIRAMIRAHLVVTILAFGAASCTTAAPAPDSKSIAWNGGRPLPRLQRSDDLLADRRGFPAREGRRRHDAARLLLRGEQLRHAPSMAARTSMRRCTLRRAAGASTRFRCEQLIGDAAVVDVSATVRRRSRTTRSRLPISRRGRSAHGSLNGTIVLIRTDYSKRWPDAARYLGTAERGESRRGQAAFSRTASGRGEVAGRRTAR